MSKCVQVEQSIHYLLLPLHDRLQICHRSKPHEKFIGDDYKKHNRGVHYSQLSPGSIDLDPSTCVIAAKPTGLKTYKIWAGKERCFKIYSGAQ